MNKASKSATLTIRDVACSFCGIVCDDLVVQNNNGKLNVLQNGCPKAIEGIEGDVTEIEPSLKGKAVRLDKAIDAICAILKKSHTPLITGLGTDVAGVRQAMHLADKTGAVVDHMHGNALIRNTLVLQDLGWITTSMSEIKNRADLIIFAGTDTSNYPRFFERVVWNEHALFTDSKTREIVYLGEKLNTKAGVSPSGKKPTVLNCKTEQIGEVISTLHTLLTGQQIDVSQVADIKSAALLKLAEKMKSAKYGVIVWAPSELDIPHAELTIQSFCEIVKYLTRMTRFACFSLGGNDGATTANNVCSWQSGYPLRVNFNKGYPDYAAHQNATANVLKHKKVDSLLWISSFNSEKQPPRASIPTVVLGRPDINLSFKPDVFVPVATPGVDHKGQLLRTDSVMTLPLKQLRQSQYASVDAVLAQVIDRL